MNDELKILTRGDVALLLRIPERSVDRIREEGKLPSFKINGSRRIRFWRDDVEKLIVAAPRRA